jgi:hypothetical protein
MSRSGSVTSLSQAAPRPAALIACACETVRSHASIAAARRTYDCAGVSTGPSSNDVMTGSAFVIMRADDGDGGGCCCCSGAAASSKLSAGSAAVVMFTLVAAAAAAPSIAGKKGLAGASGDAELAHAAVERSITPRWIRIEGNTLSAKTGRCEVCGMGKGEGPEGPLSLFAPKRMAIAFIRKSAFLKQ